MSVPDLATSISLRSRVPSLTSGQPSSGLVRWMLRATTVLVFVVATIIGVSVALPAPTQSPVSISGSRR